MTTQSLSGSRRSTRGGVRDDLALLPDRVDVVVIGLGLMGSAATWALTRRGHEVVALDALEAGHRRGSSHGSSRIFRRAYPQSDYVAMTGRALELWRELERAAGTTLLVTTGGLDHGPRRAVRPLLEALRASGVACTPLSAREVGERWPHLRLEGDALYHPEAGVIDPEATMAATARLATGGGARVVREVPVEALEPAAAGVVVRLSDRVLRARRVVVAAGPWTPKLLAGVIDLPPLTVTEQAVFHFARHDPDDGSLWPTVIANTGREVYALPGGRDGGVAGNMKLGEHTPGRVTDPDARSGRTDLRQRSYVIEHVRRFWPGLAPEPVATYDCLYTRTANDDFVIDRRGALVVCSACSGHAAKFAPLIGEWLADLVEGRALPLGRFSLPPAS